MSPGKLKFDAERVDARSSTKTLKVTNTSGASVIISGMLVTGDFAQASTCGASLAAHKTCTIRVTFTPSATGERIGDLMLEDNAANSPQMVLLSGKGKPR